VRSFRVALICLSVAAMLTVMDRWLGQHPFPRGIPRRLPAIEHYALQHPSSPRILICLALIVLLCAVQIVLVWRAQILRDWWEPIVVEVALCFVFAIAYHQIFGVAPIECGQSLASCSTLWPRLIQGSGWAVFVIIGLALGFAWSFIGRRDDSLALS
jgi:hypothetical protein